MILEAIHLGGGVITGWRYLWLKYVSGFSGGKHCAPCLVGPYSMKVRKDMEQNVPVELDEYAFFDALYLCGVASRGGWVANLHLPFVPAPGEVAEKLSSTGTLFRVTNAQALPIPGLERGYAGKPTSFTTCRNWQFGVARYGLRPKLQASAVPG